jgi:UDP-N-acetyl-D-mannosaminuronate dehydrogenase
MCCDRPANCPAPPSKPTLVVLESTTYPGTTEKELRVALEENFCLKPESSTPNSLKCRMRAGIDFHLAFSPEREDPGNQQITLSEARADAATFVLPSGNYFE